MVNDRLFGALFKLGDFKIMIWVNIYSSYSHNPNMEHTKQTISFLFFSSGYIYRHGLTCVTKHNFTVKSSLCMGNNVSGFRGKPLPTNLHPQRRYIQSFV